MAQQGDAAPRGGREEGWWQRLYDAHTTDAPGSAPGSGDPGPAPDPGGPDDPDALDDDTLDDRYASALATLGTPPPYDPEDSILPPPRDPSPAAYADPETYADPVAYEERPYEPPAAYEPPGGGDSGAGPAAGGAVSWPESPWARPEPFDAPGTAWGPEPAWEDDSTPPAGTPAYAQDPPPWRTPEPAQPEAEGHWNEPDAPTLPITPTGRGGGGDAARADEAGADEAGARDARGREAETEAGGAGIPGAGVRDAGAREAEGPDAGGPQAGVPEAGAGAAGAGIPDAGAGGAEARAEGFRDARDQAAGVQDAGFRGAEARAAGAGDAETGGAGVQDAGLRGAGDQAAGVPAEAPPAPPMPGIGGVKSRESDTLDERFASILAALGGPTVPPSPLVPAPHAAPETRPAPEPPRRQPEPPSTVTERPVTGRPVTDGRAAPPEPPVTDVPATPSEGRPEPPVPVADVRVTASEREPERPVTDVRATPSEGRPEPPVPVADVRATPSERDPEPEPPASPTSEAPPAPQPAWERPQPPAGSTAHGSGTMTTAPGLPPGWAPAPEPAPAPAPEPDPEPEPPSVRTPTLVSGPRPLDGTAGPGGVRHVGDGPPTYDPEPTAWPAAQPEALDDLVPDTLLDGARYGVLTVRAVTTRGDSARYRGRPRRDALLTARFGAGEQALLLIAVASGERGDDNAHRAAHDACRWIAAAVGRSHARLVEDMRTARRTSLRSGLGRLTDRCYGRLRARAEELGLDSTGYTAALRCLLLPADPGCRMRVCFGAGDGGLFRLRDGGWEDLDREAGAVAPAAGAAADPRGLLGGTRTLGNGVARGADGDFLFRAGVAQPGDTLLLCSGGLAAPLREEPPFAAHLAARWGGTEPPGLAAFLADAQTRAKGYADDRTAVAVWDA
jgi:hypothetical protein